MDVAGLVTSYGYWALAIGTLLEGETFLVLAGFAAHRGYLDFPVVVAVGALGGFTGDACFFLLGRRKGRPFLDRRQSWAPSLAPVRRRLERNQTALILGSRFMYGLRILIPCLLGTSDVRVPRFLFLNAVGAAAWAFLYAGGGYVFGVSLDRVLGDVARYEVLAAATLVVCGVAVWVWHRARGS